MTGTWMEWILRRASTRRPMSTTLISRRRYGLPYIILDDGWYKLGNVLEVTA